MMMMLMVVRSSCDHDDDSGSDDRLSTDCFFPPISLTCVCSNVNNISINKF